MKDNILNKIRVSFSNDGKIIVLSNFAATKVVFYDTKNNILLKVPYKENEPISIDALVGFKIEYKGIQDGLVSFLCSQK